MKKSISILVVEDQEMYRNAVCELLVEQQFVKSVRPASGGIECLNALAEENFDIVLLDIQMTGMHGIDCLAEIRENWPDQKVIMLTSFGEYGIVKRALERGAVGYLVKGSSNDLIDHLEAFVQRNERVISKEARLELVDDVTKEPLKLGKAEFNVLDLICKQCSSKEIADRLGISIHTVNTHRKELQRKIRVDNIVGLIQWAYRHGLMEDSFAKLS